ncbi:hypothetical protein COOONC_01482, partial [Cooperia oncophora]
MEQEQNCNLLSPLFKGSASGGSAEKRNGWVNVGDLQGAVHFKIIRYERIKFLVVLFLARDSPLGIGGGCTFFRLEDTIEALPQNKLAESFGALSHLPLIVDLTVEENARLKVLYGSHEGFHAIDLDSAAIYDIYTPSN